MKRRATAVQGRTRATKIDVIVTNDYRLYQMEMNGLKKGDQYKVMCSGFANVLYYKNLYKKVSLGVADLNFFNTFEAWNTLVDELQKIMGDACKRVKLVK